MAKLYRTLSMLLVLVVSGGAGSAWAATLEDMKVVSSGDGKVRLTLTFDGAPPRPERFTLSDPERLVFDFKDTSSALERRQVPIKRFDLDRAELFDDGQRLRMIVSAARPYNAEMRQNGQTLDITLSASNPEGRDATVSRITSIDFKRGQGRDGLLEVQVSAGAGGARLESDAGQARVFLPGVRLPAVWDQTLDVSDFGTPVERVTPRQVDGGVMVDVAHRGGKPFLTQQGRAVFLEIGPADSGSAPLERGSERDGGPRVTLNFSSINVREALSLLAEEGGVNLVVSDSVQGSVTLNLQNVPWQQALDIILKSKGLSSRQDGNVLMVAPADELVSMTQRRIAADQGLEQTAELAMDYLQIRYAKADDMALLLRGEEGMGLLSPRGRVMVDQRTNTLLIRDTREQLAEIRQTVSRLDVPVRQVQIEARIVIARESVTNELGVRWGASSGPSNGKFDLTGASSGTTALGGLAVDLGDSVAPSTSFSFGYLSGDVLLDLELNALETEGKSQTISQPKVITANQRKAIIKQGQEIPYQEATSSGATNVEFKEAVLALEVTPQVTPDNRIIMDLQIKNDDVSNTQYGGAPAIDTNEIQTQVLVNDGETVVLGGILSTEQLRNLYKTPFLGDIPLLGQLFRYTEESNSKVELLVFITPKIIDDSLTFR
ncbi:type IV pilus secretin PilQ [Larsenimonas salina]|uniref:type IV pilus secretin PilQ n=1 Tax=Larsenimonas salina TaxID=1295565 RepID=UPI002074A9FF|nr:type IV pilus secretin PilQ [Larsenimonas salina]MCM5704162.1 type IV pilus secretin PilQ [Larsenimonas salina]